MCRYAIYGPYKKHFACFHCRKGFKRGRLDGAEVELEPAEAPCPDCGRPMQDMGMDFKPPRKADVEHWEVTAHLFRKGFSYHSCGCGGPGFRPSRWSEVDDFLAAERKLTASEKRRN